MLLCFMCFQLQCFPRGRPLNRELHLAHPRGCHSRDCSGLAIWATSMPWVYGYFVGPCLSWSGGACGGVLCGRRFLVLLHQGSQWHAMYSVLYVCGVRECMCVCVSVGLGVFVVKHVNTCTSYMFVFNMWSTLHSTELEMSTSEGQSRRRD